MSLSRSEIKIALAQISNQICNMVCPKCRNGRPIVSESETSKYRYFIMCSYCLTKWESKDKFLAENKQSQKINNIKNEIIKAEKYKIKNNIGSVLHKNLDKIIKKGSSLIDKTGNRYTIEAAIENRFFLNNELLISKIKLCSRVELILLNKIVELCETKGKKVSWEIKSTKKTFTLELIRYMTHSCILTELTELHLLNVRAILKSLVKKGLIACCEKANFIDIHPCIIDNKKIILKLLEYQNVPNDLKYKIYSHYNFRCVHCGENNRNLRLAYTTKEKTNSSMIPICEFCYDFVTLDEILLDGTVTIFENKDSLTSWQFIVHYLPQIDNNLEAYEFNYILSLKYNEYDLIKATAIALDRISKGEKLFKFKPNLFYKYIEKVIQNPYAKNYNDINKKYNLDYWLKVI